MDAMVEQLEVETLELADSKKRRKEQPDRSVVGMDKVWYNCTDDYLD